jgi:hypothetical protein
MNRKLRNLLVMALALIVVGCASHRTRVNCDGQLKPINAPAPTAKSAHP